MPRLDGIGLAGAGFVVRNCGLRIRNDTNPAKFMSLGPSHCHCQRSCDRRPFRIVSFLVVRITNSPSSPSEGHDWTGLKLAVQQIPRTGRTTPVVPRTGRTDSDCSPSPSDSRDFRETNMNNRYSLPLQLLPPHPPLLPTTHTTTPTTSPTTSPTTAAALPAPPASSPRLSIYLAAQRSSSSFSICPTSVPDPNINSAPDQDFRHAMASMVSSPRRAR